MSDGLVLRAVSGPARGVTAEVDGALVVGREGDVRLSDPTVSRHHAQVQPWASGVWLADLESSGGTLVNGAPVTGTQLAPGSSFTVGGTELVVLHLLRYSDNAAYDAIQFRSGDRDVARPLVDQMTIGRDPACDISLDDPTVSRTHAVLHSSPTGVELEDLRSSNHTYVNSERSDGRVHLSDGDSLTFGRAETVLVYRSGPASDESVVRVSLEGESDPTQVSVAAPPAATVAQVTAGLADQMGTGEEQLLLYRLRDGVLFHPDDLWHATGTWHADRVVLGVGDASAFMSAPGRHWPPRDSSGINQLPRTVHPPVRHRVEAIDPPESSSLRGRGMVWQIAGGLGAVLIGLTLAIVNPSYAIFGLITGGIGIISIMASIFGDQSRRRYKVKEFRKRVADLDSTLAGVRESQAGVLWNLYPGTDEIGRRIGSASARIWERRPQDPDALELRIGKGTRPTLMDTDEPRDPRSELTPVLTETVNRHYWLTGVPVTVPSAEVGSFGIVGRRQSIQTLLNSMIVEAAVQLPPDQLTIFVAGTDPSWEWCRWLPQVSLQTLSTSSSGAVEVLTYASEALEESASSDASAGRLHLIVVPDSSIRYDLTAIVRRNPGRSLVLVGSSESRKLPGGLAAFITIDQARGTITGHYREGPGGPVEVEAVSIDRAEALAIELGRIAGGRDSGGSVGLVELLGLGNASNVDVLDSWSLPRNDPLTVAVGTDDSGDPVTVGFRRDGPHGMIAGTTGSGKSELLQSVLAAEVLQNPPERLNLFLVDFKGGATFAPFALLPHVVGMVTDIESDETLATRAFTSLDAEIERRKRVLETARVADVKAYERLEDTSEPLPTLVVVIDEFALLVERLPEVRERLDTVATQGRSLGIHLFLATQSPSGVITHAIRTNTNLWICLRVVADSESIEILGSREAARITDGAPGSAIIRLGAGDQLRPFQAARIARPVREEISAVEVKRLDGVTREIDGPHRDVVGARTELDLVVEAVVKASEKSNRGPIRSLWLDPLPSLLPADSLTNGDLDTSRLRAVVGLTEDLKRQVREPHIVDLSAEGHLIICGAFGSGKTTGIHQIAADLSKRFAPSAVHLFAIDGGAGGLQKLSALAHVGQVISADDTERLGRLITRLTTEMARRREHLASAGGAPFLELRARQPGLPWIVLLVDDYSVFREQAESVDHGRLLERFTSLLQAGPAVGIHLVLTTTQATDLKIRELNLMGARIVLEATDPSDYSLVSSSALRVSPFRNRPGRGLVQDGRELQIAFPDQGHVDAGSDQIRNESGPQPVRRLPTRVGRSEIDDYRSPLQDTSDASGADVMTVMLGVGGDEVEPVPVDFSRYSPVLLVSGPARSGRTTTLANISQALRSSTDRQVTVLASRPETWERIAIASTVDLYREADEFGDALQGVLESESGSSLLIVDDADSLVATPDVAERFGKILRSASQTDTLIIVAARTSDLPGMFDPWSRYLVSLRRVVLLQPTRDDSLFFGQTLPTIPEPVGPGRGILIEGSNVTVMQAFDESQL